MESYWTGGHIYSPVPSTIRSPCYRFSPLPCAVSFRRKPVTSESVLSPQSPSPPRVAVVTRDGVNRAELQLQSPSRLRPPFTGGHHHPRHRFCRNSLSGLGHAD